MGAGADYYTTYYSDYERQNPPNKIEFYLSLLEKHVAPGSSIFELGFGQGYFLCAAQARYRCFGAEPNAHGVERTKSRVGPETQVVQGSIECLPNGEMDALVAWDVLEHLTNLDDSLKTIAQRLRSGRVLIGVVPVYDGPLGWLVRLLDKDPTHVSKLGRVDWLNRVSAAGFDIVDWGGIIRKLLFGRYIHVTEPSRVLRSTGSAIYLVAKVR